MIIDSEAGNPIFIMSKKTVEESEKYLRLNFTYACFLMKSMYTKIIKTTNCERTVASAAPLIPRPSPILPKSFNSKIKIGSKIIFSTVPKPATAMGNFMSPSPASMDLKNAPKTINGKPTTIVDK